MSFFCQSQDTLMFPFLIGTVRTKFTVENHDLLSSLFPFLIGTVRTRRGALYEVSFYILQFPFLIGTVRTQQNSKRNSRRRQFPFLIGTVRTYFSGIDVYEALKFPFLIGTVRTEVAELLCIFFNGFHSSQVR